MAKKGKYQHCFEQYGALIAAKIRKDEILAEDRRQGDDAALFEWFASHDPSGTSAENRHQYLEWLCQQFTRDDNFYAHDLEKINTALTLFDHYKAELPERAIRSYTPNSLLAIIASYQTQMHLPATLKDEKLAYAQSTIVHQGLKGMIIIPHTRFAADFWADDAGWCIHSQKGAEFGNYNTQGALFIFMPANPQNDGQTKFLAHKNSHIANRWNDDNLTGKDWDVIQPLLDEALEEGSLSVSNLSVAANIPILKIPKAKSRMTEQDAFNIISEDPEAIKHIAKKYLSPELCAACIAKDPECLTLLPKEKQTLRLKMLAAAHQGSAYPNQQAGEGNPVSTTRLLTSSWEHGSKPPRDYQSWVVRHHISVKTSYFDGISPDHPDIVTLIKIALANGHSMTDLTAYSIAEDDAAIVYLSAVSSQPSSLGAVPDSVRSEGFLIRAIHLNPEVYQHIKLLERTLEVSLAYTEKTAKKATDGDAECIDATVKFLELLEKYSPTRKATDLDLHAARRDVIAAIRAGDKNAYQWLPERMRGEKVYAATIEAHAATGSAPFGDIPNGIGPAQIFSIWPHLLNPAALNCIPMALRDRDLCMQAMTENPYFYRCVPAALLADRDFILKAIPIAPGIVGQMAPEHIDEELVTLSLAGDDNPNEIWWKTPKAVWRASHADRAAAMDVLTLIEYMPQKFHTKKRIKAACRAAQSPGFLFEACIPYSEWDSELVDIVLSKWPLALSFRVKNSQDPAIPRYALTPELMLTHGQQFFSKQADPPDNTSAEDRVRRRSPVLPSDYFSMDGPHFDHPDKMMDDVYSLLAPHIQAIDPKGYHRHQEALRAEIASPNYKIEDWQYRHDGPIKIIFDHLEIPRAYCDAEMGLLALQLLDSHGTSQEDQSDHLYKRTLSLRTSFHDRDMPFFDYFRPPVFTQELFDACNLRFPGFYIHAKTDHSKLVTDYVIHPGYAAFVQQRHLDPVIEFAERTKNEKLAAVSLAARPG